MSSLFKKIENKLLKSLFSANRYACYQGVKLGRNCKLNKKVHFGSEPYLVSIGDNFYCSVNVFFITHDGSVNVFRNLHPDCFNVDYIKPISVGDNVFLGCNTTILPGAEIGSNVIIGAGSVVRGCLESNSVYAGVPAKKIMSLESYYQKKQSDFLYTHNFNKHDKKAFLERYFNVPK